MLVLHSKRMHKAASDPKGLWIVTGAVHIQGLTNPELRATLLEKLDMILAQGVGGDPDKGRGNR